MPFTRLLENKVFLKMAPYSLIEGLRVQLVPLWKLTHYSHSRLCVTQTRLLNLLSLSW